jgi:hypothetical protein
MASLTVLIAADGDSAFDATTVALDSPQVILSASSHGIAEGWELARRVVVTLTANKPFSPLEVFSIPTKSTADINRRGLVPVIPVEKQRMLPSSAIRLKAAESQSALARAVMSPFNALLGLMSVTARRRVRAELGQYPSATTNAVGSLALPFELLVSHTLLVSTGASAVSLSNTAWGNGAVGQLDEGTESTLPVRGEGSAAARTAAATLGAADATTTGSGDGVGKLEGEGMKEADTDLLGLLVTDSVTDAETEVLPVTEGDASLEGETLGDSEGDASTDLDGDGEASTDFEGVGVAGTGNEAEGEPW